MHRVARDSSIALVSLSQSADYNGSYGSRAGSADFWIEGPQQAVHSHRLDYIDALSLVWKQAIQSENPKESFGKPKRRYEDNIKMDLKEIGWNYVGWIQVAKYKV